MTTILQAKTPILFGTDPESFAVYEKEGQLYALPPYFFRHYLGVPASDDKRHPVFFEENGWKLHEDGAAFEMAIRPSFNPRDLFDTIQDCMKAAEERILRSFPEYCMPSLQFLPTVGFEVERWADEGDDFRMSTEFGCDPDFDAFNMEKKAAVIDAAKHPHRYSGGHIHFSGSKFIADDPQLAVRVLALTAGCAAVAYSDVPQLERDRTFLYGRPGKFRVQHYKGSSFGKEYQVGIEYRTVSSRWASNWNIAKEVFEWGRIAVEEFLPDAEKAEALVAELSGTATTAILEGDQETAMSVLEYLKSK